MPGPAPHRPGVDTVQVEVLLVFLGACGGPSLLLAVPFLLIWCLSLYYDNMAVAMVAVMLRSVHWMPQHRGLPEWPMELGQQAGLGVLAGWQQSHGIARQCRPKGNATSQTSEKGGASLESQVEGMSTSYVPGISSSSSETCLQHNAAYACESRPIRLVVSATSPAKGLRRPVLTACAEQVEGLSNGRARQKQ